MDNKEQTLVLVKPDAMIKGLAGEVLSTIAKEKIDLVGAKLVRVSEELAKIHYVDQQNRVCGVSWANRVIHCSFSRC